MDIDAVDLEDEGTGLRHQREPASRYTLKADRFSSHSLILDGFPEAGSGRSVLDVGCGDGHLARVLTERGYRVTGLDNDRAALSAASHFCDCVIEADLDRFEPAGHGPFDWILAADVLEHVPDPLAVSRRLVLALADDGVIVVSVPNVAHLYVRLALLSGRWDYAERGILDRTHLRFFTRRSLRQLLDSAGIRPTRMTPAGLPWSIILPSVPKAVVGSAAILDRSVARLWPAAFAYQWIAWGDRRSR